MGQVKPQLGSTPSYADQAPALDLAMLGVGDIEDYSGNIDSKKIINTGAIWTSGPDGTVLSFDGSSYVDTGVTELPGTSLFADSGQKFFVSITFDLQGNLDGTLIAKASATAADRTFQIFVFDKEGQAQLAVYYRGTVTDVLLGVENGLHTVVATWNGLSTAVYVDGTFISSPPVGVASEETSERIIIGARTNGTGFFLDGIVSHTLIYNRVPSAAEIQQAIDFPWQAWQDDNTILFAGSQVTPTGGVNLLDGKFERKRLIA